MTRVLAQLIVDVVSFLEFSDTSVVDEDAAVAQMENIAFLLEQLDTSDKKRLAAELVKIAEAVDDPARREFITDFPGTMNLI